MSRHGLPVVLSIALALCAGGGPALGQTRQHGPGAAPGAAHMSPEERQRLREDMHSARRDVYRDGQRQDRQLPPAGGRLSPSEREKLRRDVEDANRGMRRR